MTTVPPADNLPGPSMKWGRWVTATISRVLTRLDNIDLTLSNHNRNMNGSLSTLRNGLSGVSEQFKTFLDAAVFDASRITTGTLTVPTSTTGTVAAGSLVSASSVSGASLTITGPATVVGDLTVGNVITTNGTFLGTITAAALSIAQGIFPSGVRSVGARNNIVTTDYAGAWLDADGNLGIAPSSRAMKKDITNWSGTSIKNLLKLQAVMFRYNSQGSNDKKQIGLIAEDVMAAGFPEFLFYDKQGVLQGINYDRITVALIELAKYQDTRITQLENKLLTLKL